MKEQIWNLTEDFNKLPVREGLRNILLGPVGIYSDTEKRRVGLRQLMAGVKCFSVPTRIRRELVSLTEEYAKATGVSYLMNVDGAGAIGMWG